MQNRLVVRTMLAAIICMGFSAGAQAACYSPENQLPANQIQDFLKNPSSLLNSREGMGNLVATVLKLVASDSSTLPAVINLLDSANPQQKSAIGAGLAAAVQACLVPDQAFAGEIQTQLAAKGDRVALTAFVSGGGQDTATAATGFPGAPSATAFVSSASQETGAANINNTPLITQSTPTGGLSTGFTFISGAGVTTRARNSVSP